MRTNNSQTTLIQEASEALVDKLGIAKASKFWSFLGYGSRDYTKLRRQLFGKETVKTLCKKIKQFEKK